VLDYGAGTGRLVELFREAGFQADGLEFAHAARRHGLEYRGITLFARPAELPEGVYDLVTMIEVIEHLANLMEELMAIRKAMQRGGMLFVTTPNRVGLRARMEKGYWREARKKFHLFLFDRHSLKHILLRAGFSSVEVVHFSPVPKPGRLFWLYGRVCQCLRLGGTLCVTARR